MKGKMKFQEFIKKRVGECYWKDDINCAETSLTILSEIFELPLNEQVKNSVLALPGAGQCGAQCGIVSGTIMFMGIFGKNCGIGDNTIKNFCKKFANTFDSTFKSLQCSVLRPEGFHPDNPPHICESLTCDAVNLSVQLVSELQTQNTVGTGV
jgi:hypothetical protein